jgi:hypothetical protein
MKMIAELQEAMMLTQKRHDLTAQQMLLSPEEVPMFNAMVIVYMDELKPIGVEQTDLVREVVVAKWRSERFWGIEGSIFELALHDTSEATDKRFTRIDGPTRLAHAMLQQHDHVKALELVSRLEGRMRRMQERARKDLDEGVKRIV